MENQYYEQCLTRSGLGTVVEGETNEKSEASAEREICGGEKS